jgi:SAM-dependent methyltransferase
MTDTLEGSHPMMPGATHDELAEQLFVVDLKNYLGMELGPAEAGLARALDHDGDASPEQRLKTVRDKIYDYDSYRSYVAVSRAAQESLWNAVRTSIMRQADELNDRADIKDPKGSLRVNPDFEPPRYLSVADTHMMPGGYTANLDDGNALQGALMDRGGAVYMLGRAGGLINDGRGQTAMAHVLDRFPDLAPKRILDMGCGVGASTLPAKQAFPDAEVHAIDVGASVLRYAHARAEHMGYAVHFSQQSAEHTDFDDESFDLVYSCAMIHESSNSAVPNIVREMHRLLRPGAVALHLEVPLRYEDLDIWGQLICDFETRYNNEPFWVGAIKSDLPSDFEKAGFRNIASGFQAATRKAEPGNRGFGDKNLGAFRSWYVASAQK